MSMTPMFDSEDSSKASINAGMRAHDKNTRIFATLLAIGLVLGAGEGIYAWVLSNRLHEMEKAFQTQVAKQEESVGRLRNRLGSTEDQFGELQEDLAAAKNHLGKTQSDLLKTRQMADQAAKLQKDTADHFSGQLSDLQQAQSTTSGTVGTLSTDVNGVKQEVSATKADLASTRSELQRAVGDLGVQSGLIARNRGDLAELRRMGERDYFEFDLRKTNQPQKYVSGVALQLKRTDTKRQKYTVDLIADDRRIEKRDKNTNEPVQFYQQGSRTPSEIVVNQIYKDRIVGYISMPKPKVASLTDATGGSQTATSGT